MASRIQRFCPPHFMPLSCSESYQKSQLLPKPSLNITFKSQAIILALAKHYKFKSPMSWLSRFFKAFPEPLDSNYGAYVYPEISSKFILLKINELRIIKVKDKIGQTVNQSLTIKEPNSPAVPIPFIFLEKEVTHREDMLFLTTDLTDLKAGFFSPSPSLQQLYLNQMLTLALLRLTPRMESHLASIIVLPSSSRDSATAFSIEVSPIW